MQLWDQAHSTSHQCVSSLDCSSKQGKQQEAYGSCGDSQAI